MKTCRQETVGKERASQEKLFIDYLSRFGPAQSFRFVFKKRKEKCSVRFARSFDYPEVIVNHRRPQSHQQAARTRKVVLVPPPCTIVSQKYPVQTTIQKIHSEWSLFVALVRTYLSNHAKGARKLKAPPARHQILLLMHRMALV